MRIAFYEDRRATDLGPIALMRPVFELICGRFSTRERLLDHFGSPAWGALIREHLAESYRESYPDARVNDLPWLAEAPTLLINGRWLPCFDSLSALGENDAGFCGDALVALTLNPLEAVQLGDDASGMMQQQIAATRRRVDVGGHLICRPWDLIERNAEQLRADFQLRQHVDSQTDLGSQVSVLGDAGNISIAPTASCDPFVVLDVRKGPISIDDGVIIQAFTRIEGPCHVGRGSQLFRANIRGETTIGPLCRVGGEVDACILHGFVNKYHDGYLGHSYVAPWCNLGALTTNSDLKNDYSTVHVPLSGNMIDSGSTKAGCYIGDHAKTALGSLFNTGSSIGVMAMVLPGGELLPKHIPSFSRVWHGELLDGWELERHLVTARIVMNRRGCELTPAQERLFRFVHAQTQRERQRAIERFHNRKSQL